jgi:hypothetical protein
MAIRHIAWVGTEDEGMVDFARDASATIGKHPFLEFREVPGTHHSSLPQILLEFKNEAER